MFWILIAIAVILVVVTAAACKNDDFADTIFEAPQRRAGRHGEQVASDVIRKVLREGDLLFTNVIISWEGKSAELDNVIVNSYGVFIIEVKNYIGYIVGNEDDYEWRKYKTTDAGNTYEKAVKNPIKQVKRQIHILAKYLEYYGPRVWVNGYVILLHGNSPIESNYVLSNMNDIDHTIHTPVKTRLSKATIAKIAELLQ